MDPITMNQAWINIVNTCHSASLTKKDRDENERCLQAVQEFIAKALKDKKHLEAAPKPAS